MSKQARAALVTGLCLAYGVTVAGVMLIASMITVALIGPLFAVSVWGAPQLGKRLPAVPFDLAPHLTHHDHRP
jgi:alpha-beta hydrolase superfamily lysophospholipase